MIPSPDVTDLSRLQFALTALYHFLFVPLTLGLSMLLAIMETTYVMTKRPIWREMTKFWGLLFGINFAMGVATGITLEFQFGTNWSYYSHYVGDIFGVPLAIEGMMAFFLEATFVGLFFFARERLSRVAYMVVTWCVALGTNFSALWILVANGWMNNPVGAAFNVQTMRMEVVDFAAVFFNPVAQAKFVHTISAGYVCGAVFVLSISAYYLLRGRNLALARRSFTVAASFGLAAALSVVVLGDESGYLTNETQRMKLAAMEAMWQEESAPAAITLFGWPDEKTMTTHYEIKIPYILGLIATRSLSHTLPGVKELLVDAEQRIERGRLAWVALQTLKQYPKDKAASASFARYQDDLGYGLLLYRHTDNIAAATPLQIKQAARDTLPHVAPLFWGFRIMVACGLYLILLFCLAFWFSAKRQLNKRWFLWLALCSLPIPWISTEMGWIVAEYGRQPWVVQGMLPTFMAASDLSFSKVLGSLIGFIIFYSSLAVIELYLMVKYIRLGPDGLEKSQA